MPSAVCFVLFWERLVQDNFCVGWSLLCLNFLKIVCEESECYVNSSWSAVHGREDRLWVLHSDSWIWVNGVVKVPEERNRSYYTSCFLCICVGIASMWFPFTVMSNDSNIVLTNLSFDVLVFGGVGGGSSGCGRMV